MRLRSLLNTPVPCPLTRSLRPPPPPTPPKKNQAAKTPEELEADREVRRQRMREKWKDPEYAAHISAKLQDAANRKRAERAEEQRRLAETDPGAAAAAREAALARRREGKRRAREARAARLEELQAADPEEHARAVAAAEAAALEARERHNRKRREARAAVREALGLEPRQRRPGAGGGGGGARQRRPGGSRQRARAPGAAGVEEDGGEDEGMPLVSSGRALRGIKAPAKRAPRAKKAPAAAAAGSGGAAGGADAPARGRRKLSKSSREAVAEVQGRITRLLETRALVARTLDMITQLQAQMGAFANNPQMQERAAGALTQAKARLAAAQQQVVELEGSVPPSVVWDERTGAILEVRDAEGLSGSLGGGSGGSTSSRSPSNGSGGDIVSSGRRSGLNGHAGMPMVAGNGRAAAAAAAAGQQRASSNGDANGAAPSPAVDRYAAAATPSLGAHLSTLLDAADSGSGSDTPR